MKVKSDSHSVRYSPRVMRISLSQFIDSKKGHEIWINYQMQPRPSMSVLKSLKKHMTSKEGTFPML